MKYNRGIEQCEYCDVSHHPMRRWSSGEDVIFVHHLIFDIVFYPLIDISCEMLARAAGYVRLDDGYAGEE